MKLTDYKTQLILFAAYVIFWVALALIFMLVLRPPDPPLTTFIPSDNRFIEIIILAVILGPLLAIGGVLLGGYLLSPLLLYVHKKIFGKKMIYGIQEFSHSQKSINTFRGFFPALMAINFALIFAFNEYVIYLLVHPENYSEGISYYGGYIPAFEVLLIFTNAISIIVFSSAWFLEDSGIFYTNNLKTNSTKEQKVIEARAVGNWYKSIIYGYAGIGVIFSYILFIAPQLITWSQQGTAIFILNILVFIPIPFLLAIASLPAIILLDIIKEHRINYIKRIAKRFGILINMEIIIKEIEK